MKVLSVKRFPSYIRMKVRHGYLWWAKDVIYHKSNRGDAWANVDDEYKAVDEEMNSKLYQLYLGHQFKKDLHPSESEIRDEF